jgi:hypothetical protein
MLIPVRIFLQLASLPTPARPSDLVHSYSILSPAQIGKRSKTGSCALLCTMYRDESLAELRVTNSQSLLDSAFVQTDLLTINWIQRTVPFSILPSTLGVCKCTTQSKDSGYMLTAGGTNQRMHADLHQTSRCVSWTFTAVDQTTLKAVHVHMTIHFSSYLSYHGVACFSCRQLQFPLVSLARARPVSRVSHDSRTI